MFSLNAQGENYSAYDFEQRCHVGGTVPSLYHYGNGNHLTLNLAPSGFSGYDYENGKHFSGTVSGNAVSLYDYEDGKHRNYAT